MVAKQNKMLPPTKMNASINPMLWPIRVKVSNVDVMGYSDPKYFSRVLLTSVRLDSSKWEPRYIMGGLSRYNDLNSLEKSSPCT